MEKHETITLTAKQAKLASLRIAERMTDDILDSAQLIKESDLAGLHMLISRIVLEEIDR